MIRRDWFDATGRAAWLLIKQMDHAELAAQLAQAWGIPPFGRVEPAAEALPAISHHDDGWADWDAQPRADATGRPPTFNEMGVVVSTQIWDRSISSAACSGPLAQYMVAGHFCALLHRFSSWKSAGADEQTAATQFLETYEKRMGGWLADWKKAAPETNRESLAQTALRHLQFFDMLSLWLCTAEQRERLVTESADGHRAEFVPRRSRLVEVRPWPFRTERLQVRIAGAVLLQDRYQAGSDLTQAISGRAVLDVTFEPGGEPRSLTLQNRAN